jgi:hypothetical protein
VFERYTEAARGVVVHAQEESRGLGHDFIAPEHLLLGVLRQEPVALQVREGQVRALVVQRLGTGVGGEGMIPFTGGATAVLERALELALDDRHVVTPAHLLRALLEQEGPAEILHRCGRSPEQVRATLDGMPPEPARGDAEIVEIDGRPLGDLGNPRTDAALLRSILRRGGPVAEWLRERGVDEAALRERW